MVVCNFVIPFVILSLKKLRTISGCVIASLTVVVGMWLERFLIIVPSLGHKYLTYTWGSYRPQPVEIIITTATFAAMGLLYTLFVGFPLCLFCMCVGLLLCLTIIGAPLGFAVMALGAKYVTLPNRHWL